MEDIADAYENRVGNQSQSEKLRGIFIVFHEFENQLLGAGENYINLIIKGGKFYAAFAYARFPNEQNIKIARMELGEFQGKDVSTTKHDAVVAHFFEAFEKKYKSKPVSLRIMDAEMVQSYVDFLSKYGGDSSQNIPFAVFGTLLARWITALKTGSWTQYPETPFCSFLKQASTRYANLPANLISFFLEKQALKRPNLLLLDSSSGIISMKIIQTPAGAEIVLLADKEISPPNWEAFPEFLHNERVKHKVRNVIYLRLQPIIDLLKDFVVTPPPLSQERRNAVLQRILYFLTKYGENWALSPPPIGNNNLFRFLSRALGFNINLRKISYWYIPDAFTRLLMETTGGTGSILCLYYPEKDVQGYMIQVENTSITHIDTINPDFLASIRERALNSNQIPENSKQIFHLAHQSYPKLASILLVRKEFFNLLFETLPRSFLFMHPLKIFSTSHTLKRLIGSRNFYMYPETVGLQYLRKISGFKLLGWISRLFFDRHEF